MRKLNSNLREDEMTYRYGYGRGFKQRGGRGFGFRGWSPLWPYTGRGRGGMPRCFYPGLYGSGHGYSHHYPEDYVHPQPHTRTQEVEILREQAGFIRQELSEIEKRIQELQEEET